jgi:hypothetical protein
MNPAFLVLFTHALTLDSRKFAMYLARMGLVLVIFFADRKSVV